MHARCALPQLAEKTGIRAPASGAAVLLWLHFEKTQDIDRSAEWCECAAFWGDPDAVRAYTEALTEPFRAYAEDLVSGRGRTHISAAGDAGEDVGLCIPAAGETLELACDNAHFLSTLVIEDGDGGPAGEAFQPLRIAFDAKRGRFTTTAVKVCVVSLYRK